MNFFDTILLADPAERAFQTATIVLTIVAIPVIIWLKNAPLPNRRKNRR